MKMTEQMNKEERSPILRVLFEFFNTEHSMNITEQSEQEKKEKYSMTNEEILREYEEILLEIESEAVEDARCDLDCSESEAILLLCEDKKEKVPSALLICK